MPTTLNYGWTTPTPDGSSGTWDDILNAAFVSADADLFTVQTTANAALPAAGGTVTGDVTFTGADIISDSGITSSGTDGIGYATGAGGQVTQLTSKSTGVTVNKLCGLIVTHNATLNADTSVTFTVTNSTVAATDVVVVVHDSGNPGSYVVAANTMAAGSFKITLRNITASPLADVLSLRFAVIKAVVS